MRRIEVGDAAIMCRGLGHAWDEFSPMEDRISGRGWKLSLRCVRCATERHDLIDMRTGELDARRYIYPIGYKITRVPTGELRLEMRQIIRSLKSEREQQRKAS